MSTDQETRTPETALTLSKDALPSGMTQMQISQLAEHVLGRIATAIIHNFDGDKMNQWRLTALATGSECLKFDDLGGDKINVRYFYAHPVEIVRADGEIVQSTRCVLITDDLVGYAFVSQGVAKGLGQIIQIWGWGPYTPSLSIRVTKSKTKSGHIYNIVPADD